jgi:agmatine/peptidylarginine deiminase
MVPSPRDDSLFVPSRTSEHARTFVSWPCREDLWGDLLAEAEAEYAAVVGAIARHEPVTVIAPPGVEPRLPAGTAYPVDVVELPIDDREEGRASTEDVSPPKDQCFELRRHGFSFPLEQINGVDEELCFFVDWISFDAERRTRRVDRSRCHEAGGAILEEDILLFHERKLVERDEVYQ